MTCANVLVGLGKDREGMEAMRLSVSLREGSDRSHLRNGRQAADFNPRSREGSDSRMPEGSVKDQISIHAPAKGATLHNAEQIESSEFQSTLPRRERHALR